MILWASEPGRSESDVLSMAKFGRHYPDRLLSDVTKDSLVAALSFCGTPATYMRYRARLMAILNLAKAQGWLLDVPVLPTRKVAAKPRQWITREEWGKLFVKLPPHQRLMAKFAIETGLRQANVLGLTWDRVDIERRVAWVEAEDAKAKKAIPIPLSDGAVDVLEACKGVHKQFVFTYAGKPIKEVKTAFQRACVQAGLGAFGAGGYSGFTWHGLRHTWATWHRLEGTPLDVLQKLGGWTDSRMVQNYAHFSPDYLAKFVSRKS